MPDRSITTPTISINYKTIIVVFITDIIPIIIDNSLYHNLQIFI